MNFTIETSNLCKRYKDNMAINDVSVTIKPGSIYGLIGKNGAGKTTLLKLLSGLIIPSSGEIKYKNSGEIVKDSVFLRKVGILIENPGLFGDMTAYDNIKLKAICLGIRYTNKQILDLLDLVGLSKVGKKKSSDFSLGMKQRLGIGLALVGEPSILILDEPINGLDPQGIVEIRHLLARLNKERGMTIIISSHILDELSKLATDYCIIHEGKVLIEASKEELDQASGEMKIEDYYLGLIGGIGEE